ncbi:MULTISPECIES: hypothetical protein [unclassified Streptomyces]|uniref:hypothetical protein n=1 Tax=unclassified Streptomyces TaxID=2593676 RepID=UPI002DD82EE2|nr:hypothetical protein [Streptomyces sp. NBC_01750]WSA98605.1 hypothetical protein OIE54_04655 [Streptomyces sp. NBC_01794]WSD36859.1 hypothetical protein OG966_36130 [Streptomyces sp. NBC_01750]
MFMAVIIAVAVVVVAAALFAGLGRDGGGRGLKRRFGPEYDRAVALHDGDTRAAERELDERVKRHGSLKEQPLPPETREQYVAQWAGIQEQFVDSPQKAVIEADALLARLAKDRGFPDGEQFEEQAAAISVHHADHVEGYLRVHTAVRGQGGTEEMREAMVEARGLFDALITEQPADWGGRRRKSRADRGHTPWTLSRHHTKGSDTR